MKITFELRTCIDSTLIINYKICLMDHFDENYSISAPNFQYYHASVCKTKLRNHVLLADAKSLVSKIYILILI